MIERCGWLLDLYPDARGGFILWLITDTGKRLRLRQWFPVTFSVAGPADRLRAAWRWLKNQREQLTLARGQGRDLFLLDPVTTLTIQVDIAAQSRLFYRLSRMFPDLDYYDADVQPALRHAAVYGTFPLARVRVLYDADAVVIDLQVLDLPWEIDPAPAPLRILHVEPDVDPNRAAPCSILVYDDTDFSVELPLEDPTALLTGLVALLTEQDPDVLLTRHGDAWLLPYLIEHSQNLGIPLPLNRGLDSDVRYRDERSYFSYGKIVYNGRQVHLAGRLHLDRSNSFLLGKNGIDGILESARVTALPIQTAARTSPGTGISSMQILTALREGILVPWHKQQVEGIKTARELIRADQGGIVYQPIVGLHQHIAEIDFVSMYPSIMVHSNISPEYPTPTDLNSDLPPGLIPLTLAPLLDKRVAIKTTLASMDRSDPRRQRYEDASAAYKWLLVTCFGYLGYKNARFGKIESHESVTAWGREALLRAKEAAEAQGYTILHMYVDALWIHKPGVCRPDQLESLQQEIGERTGLAIALDGIYDWIAFLPSRVDDQVPVANSFFGAFQDGEVKLRGIEARREDTAPFVASTQRAVIHLLAGARSEAQRNVAISQAQQLVQRRIADLRNGQVQPSDLVVSQRLGRELAAYKTPTPAARALLQLHAVGRDKKPGQRVRLIYTRTPDGVHAWDLPTKLDMRLVNVARYEALLRRAVKAVLAPLGVGIDRQPHISHMLDELQNMVRE